MIKDAFARSRNAIAFGVFGRIATWRGDAVGDAPVGRHDASK
jgi:hypothetical protein